MLATTLPKTLFLLGHSVGVSTSTPSSENSKIRIASVTLTMFVAYRPIALNRRRGHRMVHYRHSSNVSLKILLTGVVDFYAAVMDTPTSVGYTLFPF